MLFGIAIAVGLFTWAILGMAALGTLPKDIAKHFDEPMKRVAWIVRGLGALLTIAGVISYFVARTGILHDFSAEMVGIGLGVWGIDELNRWRSAQGYKRDIIRQMASRSNDFALDAARIAKDEGWLKDGSLRYANLQYAHLQDAYLEGVHLQQAVLFNANLQNARLMGAHLSGALIQYAKLQGAVLIGADLRKAYLMGSHLEGANLVGSHLEGAVYNNHTQWPEGFDPKQQGAINLDELSEEEREERRKKHRSEQE